MVVNYDIPLMNERGKDSNEPDVETYLHRIGAFPPFSPRNHADSNFSLKVERDGSDVKAFLSISCMTKRLGRI